MSKSRVKTILIVFFDHRGIGHHEFVPEGTTVFQHVYQHLYSTYTSQDFYKEVLRRLISRVKRIRRDLWETKSWMLHHDNAPVHADISVQQFLAEKQVTVLEHLP